MNFPEESLYELWPGHRFMARADNSKTKTVRLAFFFVAHDLDKINPSVNFHEQIQYGSRIMVRTQIFGSGR